MNPAIMATLMVLGILLLSGLITFLYFLWQPLPMIILIAIVLAQVWHITYKIVKEQKK
jgi:uncharacterized membrane protein